MPEGQRQLSYRIARLWQALSGCTTPTVRPEKSQSTLMKQLRHRGQQRNQLAHWRSEFPLHSLM